MKLNDFFREDGKTLDWGRIETIPEFARLAATKQSNIWHREGDVLAHTKLVCRHMAELLAEEEGTLYYRIMMAAAACHDLGKPDTTYFDVSDNDYHCKNHGDRGDKITRALLREETPIIRETVCYIVRNHMTLHHILSMDPERIDRKLITMSWGYATVNDMLKMKIADSRGSVNDSETEEVLLDTVSTIRSKAMLLGCLDGPYRFPSRTAKHMFFATGKVTDAADDTEARRIQMYVMVGLPGSGKNFTADHLLEKDVRQISRDDIRKEIGMKGEKPQGDRDEESKVTRIFNRKVREACRNGEDFVSNNVNVRLKYRRELADLVKTENVTVTYIIVDTQPDVCKQRREGMIPEDVIDRMDGYYEFPTPIEYDHVLMVRNGKIEPLGLL